MVAKTKVKKVSHEATKMKKILVGITVCILSKSAFGEKYVVHEWKKIRLTDKFWSEGAYAADFDKDGHGDVVYGPYLFAGPSFKKRIEFRAAEASFALKKPDGSLQKIPGFKGELSGGNGYSDNFLTYVEDLNGDGWEDVIAVPWPGKITYWYENPKGKKGHWTRHFAFDKTDNESPMLTDLTGDGKPELVCNSEGYVVYAEPNRNKPSEPWTVHRISAKGKWQRYTHGIGHGDVNGDGRPDIILREGWWEQPENLKGDPEWTFHPFAFGAGGAQMLAYDVNGDGLNDVITSLAAHGYGLAWYEQFRKDGKISFKPRIIINSKTSDSPYGVKFSQLHALDFADMDDDGLLDIVTGKRFWAHGPKGDAEPNAPAVLYWFRLTRPEKGKAHYIPHLIDDDSGVGTQVAAIDVNNDKLLDIVVGNKKGAFVHLHSKRKVSKAEWEKKKPRKTGNKK